MAKDSFLGSVLKWGALLGGGYYIYEKFFASGTGLTVSDLTTAIQNATSGGGSSSGSSSSSSSSSTPPAPPSYQYVPPTAAQALASAAASDPALVNGKMNADEWLYFWQNTLNKPALPAGVFDALFFPNGRPADPKNNPVMTAADFVAALATKGVSGLGAVSISVPLIVNYNGQKALVWATQHASGPATATRGAQVVRGHGARPQYRSIARGA